MSCAVVLSALSPLPVELLRDFEDSLGTVETLSSPGLSTISPFVTGSSLGSSCLGFSLAIVFFFRLGFWGGARFDFNLLGFDGISKIEFQKDAQPPSDSAKRGN